MIRILKRYLAKDLAKIAVLATIVITIMMTVLAIIEPLRERGLGGSQAIKLFAYSLPVMFSLTLPVAALFAATFVYGRFAQDNELSASRASGICPLALLKPAAWMGGIVSLATLLLSLWVAPWMLASSQRDLEKNIQQAAYHQLMTYRYLKLPDSDLLTHADHVDLETGWLAGVVVVEHSDELDAKAIIAPLAKPEFPKRGGQTYMVANCVDPAWMQQSGAAEMGMQEILKMQRGRVRNPFKDKPRFYDWNQLCSARTNPSKCSLISSELAKISRELCIQRFYRELIENIRTDGRYDRLEAIDAKGVKRADRVSLVTSRAKLIRQREVILGAPQPTSGPARRAATVKVTYHKGDDQVSFLAQEVKVQAQWDDIREAVVVSVIMMGARAMEPMATGAGHQEYPRDEFAVPADILAEANDIDLDELVANPGRYNVSSSVTSRIDGLHKKVLPKLLQKVRAEMHWRIAYASCCLLMVLTGAALGLIFRGGQVLAAMALSAVPASLVIVLLLMGKELISSGSSGGVIVIWTGVAAMVAATAYIYAVPMRR